MFKHNLLLIFRNFKRFKSAFFINLIGLSTGLACALLIYLWVNDELRVDKFHENDSRLFQVMQNLQNADGAMTIEATPGRLAEALAEEIPEIDYAASVVPATWFSGKGILSFGDRRIRAGGQFVGKDYFDIFSCNFIEGDKSDALSDKYSIALSEELALKLFNSTDNIVGKTVEWNQYDFGGLYHVTGVFKNPPSSATAQFDLLLNYDLFFEKRPGLQYWGNSDPSTFVILKAGTDVGQVNEKIEDFLKSKNEGSNNTLFLQRYSERYLRGRYENGVPSGGRIEYVRLFSIVAIFILLIACINFMNLSTAKASRRLKEVGIKKAIGAGRRALIFQYFQESLLMAFLSLIVAVFLVELFLPQFNAITEKELALAINSNMILSALGIAFLTGIISGSYPALYLSGFKPAMVLKGKLDASMGDVWARKGLVIFQFAISVILIVSVLVVYKQIGYVQSKNLGYNRENILHFEFEVRSGNDENFLAEGGALEKNVEAFLNEVKQIPGVVHAANFSHDVTGSHGGLGGFDWQDGNQDEEMHFSNLEVGFDFIETLGIEMAAGRTFSRDFGNERSKIIFNEESIARMGLKDPVGKTIKLWGRERQIIGIAKNFHFESLYEKVKPCLIQLEPRSFNIMVKMKGGTEKETIARLQKLYHEHSPGLALDYKFLDDDYQALYASEQRVGVLSRYFAGIAIIISCLGLFGLAAFTAERRRKEIGIRKALGASELGIIYLLSSDFTKMVFASIVIALPVSYLAIKYWLDNFAYRIELEPWYFISAGLMALFIAWLTVGTQAIKAANVNPAQCLRDE